jgi:two-component system NtrC family sensor kinase
MRRDVDESVQKDLDKILTQAKRASKIIANLQSFARRYKPKKAPVHVVDILEKVIDFRSYEMQVCDIDVVKNIEPHIPLIMGDEHQLDQAFLNMIVNAEQSMTEARGKGTLTIDVRRVDDKVRVSISDDGLGISEEKVSKIFDPFFTTREVGQGTGLGLSICYGIIHEHDGTISVESRLDGGAAFIVDLPIGDVELDMPIDETFFAELPDRMKILIVDDEPAVAEFLSRALTDSGHSVDVHERGEDVIQKSDLDQYDLMILDVRMPGVDGEALFEHVRGLYADAPPRILFITGDTTNPSTKAFVDRTGSPALTKPFTLEHLMSAIKRLG